VGFPRWGSRGGVPADGAQMRMTRTVLNPDGITTAWNKDRTKILHSHSATTAHPPDPGEAREPGQAHRASLAELADHHRPGRFAG